ncbi:CAMK family protein kinase [Tritrichomonas foetus]|uniref:CAMK family protein kinase n=1 Tax=Tritrichomonas foetus TaxID=1144522 RepID=A0A1J4L6N2_9EUKA|nr:CAMK family protein kinase [Tritrichomonas foetus]|eukprot:OHT17605.1 CAMK family protein kinase [Tritrichomonas foetus]
MIVQDDNYDIGHYRVVRGLGSGQSSKVKLAEDLFSNDYVAIKIIKKDIFASDKEKFIKLQREIALMSLLDHPHILRLIEVLESNRHLHLVIEYASNGELFDLLVHEGQLSEEVALNYFRELVYAIDYLHQHGICHRDLKPENILLDDCNHIKLADFGFARWMKDDIAETSCGSPHYAAPEIIRGISYNGKAVDIWSLGVILFAMIAVYFFMMTTMIIFFDILSDTFCITFFYYYSDHLKCFQKKIFHSS